MIGYDIGIVSAAIIFIKNDFLLDKWWQEMVISLMILTAWIFSMIAGYSADAWGRRKVIMLASLLFTMGALIMALSPNKVILIIGRLVIGSAVGFSSFSVPMYIAESAPSEKRGPLVTLNACFIAGGQFAASIIAGLFSASPGGWR